VRALAWCALAGGRVARRRHAHSHPSAPRRRAGSADAAVIPSGIGGFIACKALSKRNSDPSAASRPWDQERDGFVMGEGAGSCLAACAGRARALLLPRGVCAHPEGALASRAQAACARVTL
jgi:hypothetical protein